MKDLAGVLLIEILIAAWMFRWGIVDDAGEAEVGHKLDRWTGTSYVCREFSGLGPLCVKETNR